MPKSIAGTTAATQKDLAGYKIVYLVEIDADEPDQSTTTQYYGSRKYTLGANTYGDDMAIDGLALSWSRLRVGGGLAAVSGVQLSLRNEEKESNLVDTYFLENDELRVYVIFVTGSETASDKIELARAVIENYPFDPRQWNIDAIDGSDKDFREIPAKIIDLVDFPDASLDALGKVIPVAFGTLNVGPYDNAGAPANLAPCRLVDIFQRKYTSGLQNDVYGQPYQYYPQARRFAEIVNYTQTGGYFTVDDAARTIRLAPVLPDGTNDVSGWKAVADGDTSAGVDIVNTDNLDVLIGGTPKLGTITSATVEIQASGGYTYTIKLAGVTKHGPTAVTGNQSITLTAATTDHADDWDFENYSVEIDGTGNATINEIYLELNYDDQQTADRQSLVVFQKVTGFEDLVGYYNDGSVVNSSGAALTNPAHILEAIFRGKIFLNQAAAGVNLTAFDAAATARTTWAFAFALDSPVSIDWLNEYAFQAGMHLYKNYAGQWSVVAQDKTRAPDFIFLGSSDVAIKNPNADPSRWDYDLSISRSPVRDLINEIALRYNRNPATGQYGGLHVKSGRYRVTGTGNTAATGATLTDATATFQTDGVAVGDRVYVSGDKDYSVTAVTSETVLALGNIEGAVIDASSKTYYVGPNLDGRMVRSQLRYKTENPLGRARDSFLDVGGYTSDLIADATTAGNLVDHLIEWRSQRRLTVEFATFLNAVDAELGDVVFFDHAWLPTSKRPVILSTLNGAVNNSTTSFVVATGEGGFFRAGDYLLVGTEVVSVDSVNYSTDTLTVTRAATGSTAAAHSDADTISLLNRIKWEITGLQPDVSKSQIRVEIQEMPNSYNPTGRVVASGYPGYNSATTAQRTTSGWATKPSGRVVEADEYSNISYVGPAVA